MSFDNLGSWCLGNSLDSGISQNAPLGDSGAEGWEGWWDPWVVSPCHLPSVVLPWRRWPAVGLSQGSGYLLNWKHTPHLQPRPATFPQMVLVLWVSMWVIWLITISCLFQTPLGNLDLFWFGEESLGQLLRPLVWDSLSVKWTLWRFAVAHSTAEKSTVLQSDSWPDCQKIACQLAFSHRQSWNVGKGVPGDGLNASSQTHVEASLLVQ